MDAKSETMLVSLPKTNQSFVYVSGDDGTYQAGWWKGSKVSQNRTRFIVQQINGVNVTIDRATGLMWPTDWEGAGGNFGETINFAGAIAYAKSIDLAGFTDWRLPNKNEFQSLVSLDRTNPCIITDYFIHVEGVVYWTSTTYADLVSSNWVLDVYDGYNYTYFKNELLRLLCCRVMP